MCKCNIRHQSKRSAVFRSSPLHFYYPGLPIDLPFSNVQSLLPLAESAKFVYVFNDRLLISYLNAVNSAADATLMNRIQRLHCVETSTEHVILSFWKLVHRSVLKTAPKSHLRDGVPCPFLSNHISQTLQQNCCAIDLENVG